jgi:hypothetical protein
LVPNKNAHLVFGAFLLTSSLPRGLLQFFS